MNVAIGDDNDDENRILLLFEKEPNLTAKKMSEKTGFSTEKACVGQDKLYILVLPEKGAGKQISNVGISKRDLF